MIATGNVFQNSLGYLDIIISLCNGMKQFERRYQENIYDKPRRLVFSRRPFVCVQQNNIRVLKLHALVRNPEAVHLAHGRVAIQVWPLHVSAR